MNKKISGVTLYLILIMMIVIGFKMINPPNEAVPQTSVTEFTKELQNKNIKSVDFDKRVATYTTKDDKVNQVLLPDEVRVPIAEKYVLPQMEADEIVVKGTPDKVTPIYMEYIPMVLILIAMGAFWYYMINQSQGGGGSKMNNFSKSKARSIKPGDKNLVQFDDVAGLVEEKEELSEIVDFLKNPKKFTDMGARIPKGVLLVGPPGTGKTYLSRAVAGEAKVPFYIMSGSDFVEMFVGVGASRVRDLFETAKKTAPCIIFIDEIDAVGRRRGAGLGGGHDEREQTLNQLLVEMDGFSDNEGVIIMAATNRADILDPALLRPGRFDRTVYVGRPDVRGREEILKIHSKNKKVASDIDFSVIAKRTPGFSPADLENLMNESALLAARRNSNVINMEDVNEASIKVQAGPAKKSKVVTERERKLTAIHEAGHAVVSSKLKNADPVHMITIIPRGMAGGFTAYIPEDDVNFMTKGQMEDELVSLLGGRVAESLALDDISTGAQNDIERASAIARAMVTVYGMSDKLGTINYSSSDNEIFVGRDLGKSKNYSENTAFEIDEEISRLINTAYNKAKTILSENLDKLIELSDILLEKETIGREEFEAIMNGEKKVEQSTDENSIKIEQEDLSEEAKNIIEDK